MVYKFPIVVFYIVYIFFFVFWILLFPGIFVWFVYGFLRIDVISDLRRG